MLAAGTAPPGKAMPLGGEASLTLSGELRVRGTSREGLPLPSGEHRRERLLRGVFGADLRIDRHWRLFAEVGTGQVDTDPELAPANLQNAASLQQAFVEARTDVSGWLLGAMVGRQEFADGPPQLISLGDGANLHRTWNGARLFAHSDRLRLGAFDLEATRHEPGAFDEELDRAERLQGVNAGYVVAAGPAGESVCLDPFWFHSEDPDFLAGASQGLDRRDTFGLRLWGRNGGLRFDWTAARQTGAFDDREVEALGLFTSQSLALSSAGWLPRLTAHVDVASGGGTYGTGPVHAFNPLYTSSSYLGEGRFLALSNLLLIAPGFAVSPTKGTTFSLEYGIARRLAEEDAVYFGGMRAGPGTQDVPGQDIGKLLRIGGKWSPRDGATLSFGFEHLEAGDVLDRAGLPSGSYGFVSMTLRF